MPEDFWNFFRVDSTRILLVSLEMMAFADAKAPEDLVKYFREKLSLMEQHGSGKVIDIGLEGATDKELLAAEQQMSSALGSGVTVLKLRDNTGKGYVVTVGPADYDRVLSAIQFGSVTLQDEPQRKILVRSHIASGTLAADAPDWPEFDQPSHEEAFLYGPGRAHWESRAELAQRYGGDQLAFVEVVNGEQLPLQRRLSNLLANAAKSEFCRYRDGHAMLGPVSDFESFCRAIDFGEILAKDAASKFVRIRVDEPKYVARAGVVQVEVLDSDKVKSAGPDNRDDPRENLFLSLKLVAQADRQWEFRSLKGQQNRYEFAPVRDFDEFCKRLTFVDIVEKDPAARSLKVRLKPDQLTGDAVLKRVPNVDELEPWERKRLGLPEADKRDLPTRDTVTQIPRDFTPPEMSDRGRERQALPEPSDPDYHKKLCDFMVDKHNWVLNEAAVDALLREDPSEIKDKEVRQQIARNFRTLAQEPGHSDMTDKAIRGLVLYGGKFSVPILIEMVQDEKLEVDSEVFNGLAQLNDPRGADAVAKMLGNFFNHKKAVQCLREMGPVAEDALIKAARSDNVDVSLAAVELLGEVGTSKSSPVLRKALASTNAQVREAAKEAAKQIRERESTSHSATTKKAN